MNFLELAKRRCTTRGFTNEKISKDDLNLILSVSRVAPSACNKQPQRIIVVEQPENMQKVQKAYQTFGSQCVLIVCRDTREELIRPFDGKCSGDLDIGIVCDHIMLAARELNIGSVMVGLFDPRIIRKEFDIPEYIVPTALIFLGYPSKSFLDSERHKTERKPLEDTIMYEVYSGNKEETAIMPNDLLTNLDKIHTTELGIVRIKRNLKLETDDVVNWCKQKIKNSDNIVRKGKNWYVHTDCSIITINAHSYTIITAHQKR